MFLPFRSRANHQSPRPRPRARGLTLDVEGEIRDFSVGIVRDACTKHARGPRPCAWIWLTSSTWIPWE